MHIHKNIKTDILVDISLDFYAEHKLLHVKTIYS